MSRHRSSTKKAPPEIGLHMECVEEDLEPCQIVHYNKAETEYNEIQNKLDNYINKMKAEVIEKGENCLVLQLNVTTNGALGNSSPVPPVTTSGKITRHSVQSPNYQQVVGQGILTRSSASSPGSTYLVMDPRIGLVVGQVPPTTVPAEQATASPAKSAPASRTRSSPGTVMVTTRARSGVKKPVAGTSDAELITSPSTRTRDKAKNQSQVQLPTSPTSQTMQQQQQQQPQQQPQQQQQVYSPGGTSTSSVTYRVKINSKQIPPPAKPSENNAYGGLTAGSKIPWRPNSDDGNKGNAADSREITFNKMSGKTFPSLVVAARPHLRLKYIPQSTISHERTTLDGRVKGVLMYTPSKFTEWLIQQGLIRSEQICQFHVNNDLTPVRLKLGMYSDVTKFPYSGGYVWISECCPLQFVSVFCGSIFEGAPHPPTTLLKLIYHWACQTNVQNVVQWVKVDNQYVKNFFTNMRAVCTQAIHQKHQKLGGPRSKIEVGVISLGTTSQDGNMRQVKVEVLGVMDPENKLVRLRALEPISEERNFKRRFVKILEPLEDWVHKESTIFTDFTVDRGTLINMGFRTVYQISTSDPPAKYSNQNVMDYLRRIVPRMFQNTLSLLSRQIIQQFLDELVWREMWGPIPSQAFVNIIAHLAEQTKLDASENLLFRLTKVASNPFKNWNYSVWKPVPASLSNTKVQPMIPNTEAVPVIPRVASADTIESGSSVLKNSRVRKRVSDQGTIELVDSNPAKKILKFSTKDRLRKDEKIRVGDKIFKRKEQDKEKLITQEIMAFINNEPNQIPLDSYYYGTIPGDEDILYTDYKGKFQARCSVCNHRFDDNIDLMKHMILHTQSQPFLTVKLNKVHQCNYCFRGFNTSIGLNEHLDEEHSTILEKSDGILNCQICEESFDDRVELIYHMHRTHVEMELPYECGVCFFKTSVYKMFIDHFNEVHKGGEHVFCPYCLKVVSFAYKGKCLSDNIKFYENHLEKHTRPNLIVKCHRCKLSFIHKGIFYQHMEADHCSLKNDSDVKRFANGSNTVMMPQPGSLIKLSTLVKVPKNPRAKALYVINKFTSLDINGLKKDMACIECEGSLLKPQHFTGDFNCLRCRYATCCEKAMIEHATIFHDSATPQFSLGKPTVLVNGMFCMCGFSTFSGNKLAKHLEVCEKKSAYPDEESANNAAGHKESSPSQQQTDGQNVLNLLGLVRKSPENGILSCETVKESEIENIDENVKQTDVKFTEEIIIEDNEEFHSVCKEEYYEEAESSEKSDNSSHKNSNNADVKESVSELSTNALSLQKNTAPDKDVESNYEVAQNELKIDITAHKESSNDMAIEINQIMDKTEENVSKTTENAKEITEDFIIEKTEPQESKDSDPMGSFTDVVNTAKGESEENVCADIKMEIDEMKFGDAIKQDNDIVPDVEVKDADYVRDDAGDNKESEIRNVEISEMECEQTKEIDNSCEIFLQKLSEEVEANLKSENVMESDDAEIDKNSDPKFMGVSVTEFNGSNAHMPEVNVTEKCEPDEVGVEE